jgi:hypothetical protein
LTSGLNARLPDNHPDPLRDLWVAGAVHVALQLRKLHQTLKKNKGHTVLIFDENKVKADRLNEVQSEPRFDLRLITCRQRLLLGIKRTWRGLVSMSANDPKQTLGNRQT